MHLALGVPSPTISALAGRVRPLEHNAATSWSRLQPCFELCRLQPLDEPVQKVEVHAAHKLRVILGERVEMAVGERDDSASVRGSSTSISRATPAHQSPVTSQWAGPQGKA